MSWCCPLFICLSFFFWSELAEYVMVLSTVYMFVFFFLVGAGRVCHGVVHCLFVCHFSSGRSRLSMSWCCPLFICLSFFFWSELAEYVMVLSTVYLFVIFLLAGAGRVCHGVVHCLYVCLFSSGRSWLSMSWCCPLFICLSFFFWPELAEYVMVLSTVYLFVIFVLVGAG